MLVGSHELCIDTIGLTFHFPIYIALACMIRRMVEIFLNVAARVNCEVDPVIKGIKSRCIYITKSTHSGFRYSRK